MFSHSTNPPTTSTLRALHGWPGTSTSAGPRTQADSWWSPTTGGSSMRSAPTRGKSTTARSTSLREATRPMSCSGSNVTALPQRQKPSAKTSCAKNSLGCVAVLPPAPPSRSSALRQPTSSLLTSRRCATHSNSNASRCPAWARTSSTLKTWPSPTRTATCSRMSRGGSPRVSAPESWAATALENQRSWG